MAYSYVTVNNKLASTADLDSDVFNNGEQLSQIRQEWSSLRDRLQGIFGHTAENLEDAARVLMHIVEMYSTNDTEAAQEMRRKYASSPYGQNSGDKEISSMLKVR